MAGVDPYAITLVVSRQLDRLGIPHADGGSLASSLHGIPRTTRDADIVAALEPDDAPRIARTFAGGFYADEEQIALAIGRRGSFNLIHLESMFKIDVFVVDSPEVPELARRLRVPLDEKGGDHLPVVSAEDIVVEKLRWYRLGEGVSDRQWEDARGVLRVSWPRLDREYLAAAARRLAVEDLLLELLAEEELG